MGEISKRIRKRGEKKRDYLESLSQEQQPEEIIIKQDPTEEESDNFITRTQSRKQQEKLQIKQAIDEMNADITDDRRLELDEIIEEGLFDGEVSDEYWYFLGRYE